MAYIFRTFWQNKYERRESDLEHWREPFEGEKCVQVFLHYNKARGNKNLYDNRPALGLPSWYSNND